MLKDPVPQSCNLILFPLKSKTVLSESVRIWIMGFRMFIEVFFPLIINEILGGKLRIALCQKEKKLVNTSL